MLPDTTYHISILERYHEIWKVLPGRSGVRAAVHLTPVRTIADFRCLDEGQVMIGYMDGVQGLPFVGTSMDRSYWHGWRNGAVDGGFIAPDEHQVELQEEFNALAEA